MNKWLKKVVSRRRSINKSTSKINQELIPLVTKLVLFRATIWPLKISFPGCALKQENWVKTKRKEGRGGGEKRKYGVKKNPLFHCATTTNHFHKIFIQRVYGKIENVRQQVRQEGVKCWNAHGRGNGAYLRADPWRISSLSSYPWILTPVYGISTTYSRIHLSSVIQWVWNIWNVRPQLLHCSCNISGPPRLWTGNRLAVFTPDVCIVVFSI